MTKTNETENQCRCQTTDCGCAGNADRCVCDAPCSCKVNRPGLSGDSLS